MRIHAFFPNGLDDLVRDLNLSKELSLWTVSRLEIDVNFINRCKISFDCIKKFKLLEYISEKDFMYFNDIEYMFE